MHIREGPYFHANQTFPVSACFARRIFRQYKIKLATDVMPFEILQHLSFIWTKKTTPQGGGTHFILQKLSSSRYIN